MKRARSRGALLVTLWAGGMMACSSPTPPNTGENTALGGEVAARVNGQPLPLAVVRSVAEKQNVTVSDAARRVIDDEVAAAGARTRALDQKSPTSWQLVAARGRFTADRFFEEAKRRGPPTEEEVDALSEKHWAEVDRPPTFRVLHAVVMPPKNEGGGAAAKEAARRAAEEIRSAVVGQKTEVFEARAKAVQKDPKLELKVERITTPFTDDGWVASEGKGRMDPAFSRAAANLAVGDTSPVVESSFGFHVIRMLERLPEKRMPRELRRIAFADEVYSLRARDLHEATLRTLRAAHPIAISPAAEQLMRASTVEVVGAGAAARVTEPAGRP